VYLYDGTDGRKLSDATLSSAGAELVGVNASEFTTIAPAANNVLAALKSADLYIGDIIAAGTGVLNNFAATIPPTVNDDSIDGYSVGSMWVIVGGKQYICVNASAGAAEWRELKTDLWFEDFNTNSNSWQVNTAFNGTAQLAPSLAALGYPSTGAAMLQCTTDAGSKANILQIHVGFALGASNPITAEVSYAGPFNGSAIYSDDECQFYAAMADQTGTNIVGLGAIWSGAVRSYALLTIVAGVTTSEALTMPAVTNNAKVRLTITETGTKEEVAADGGAFSTILNGVAAPAQVVYQPYLAISKDTGAGNRLIAFDYFSVNASRSATDVGSFVDVSTDFGVPAPDVLALLAANTSPVNFNNVLLQNVTNPATAQDAATKSSSEAAATAAATNESNLRTAAAALTTSLGVNNQRINGLANGIASDEAANVGQVNSAIATAEAYADAQVATKPSLGTGIVSVGSANSDGAGSTAAKVDHIHDHGAQTAEWMHATATKDAGGFVDKDTWDQLLGKTKNWIAAFREVFGVAISGWATTNSGTGSGSTNIAFTTGSQPSARVVCGTTATGYAFIRTFANWITAASYSQYEFTTVAALGAVPFSIAPADNFAARVCVIGVNSAGAVSGDAVGFRATSASANWQATKWISGTPTDIDTGVACDTSPHRFKIAGIPGTSITFYIDDVQVAQITSSFPTLAAAYAIPIWVEGVAYTSLATRTLTALFTKLLVKPSSSVRG
jgi:hypothetical protein